MMDTLVIFRNGSINGALTLTSTEVGTMPSAQRGELVIDGNTANGSIRITSSNKENVPFWYQIAYHTSDNRE